ncbi:hypothetical protein IWW45_005658 [Coemansia sp. RSA 485]|nr:hypothetical protein IWW45_005658 [Coemansia sp. RSA 485]
MGLTLHSTSRVKRSTVSGRRIGVWRLAFSVQRSAFRIRAAAATVTMTMAMAMDCDRFSDASKWTRRREDPIRILL